MKAFSRIGISIYISTGVLLMALVTCASPQPVTTSSSTPEQLPKPPEHSVSSPPVEQPSAPANGVDIVMFHPKVRCASCISIEARTRDLLEDSFKDVVTSGKLTFQSYELQDKQNAGIVKKYGAVGSQLFITTVKNGTEKIRHIEEVWMPQLLNSGPAFDEFLRKIISQSLKEVS